MLLERVTNLACCKFSLSISPFDFQRSSRDQWENVQQVVGRVKMKTWDSVMQITTSVTHEYSKKSHHVCKIRERQGGQIKILFCLEVIFHCRRPCSTLLSRETQAPRCLLPPCSHLTSSLTSCESSQIYLQPVSHPPPPPPTRVDSTAPDCLSQFSTCLKHRSADTFVSVLSFF